MGVRRNEAEAPGGEKKQEMCGVTSTMARSMKQDLSSKNNNNNDNGTAQQEHQVVPLALRGLVKRLEAVAPDLSRDYFYAILFVVRLGDNLHHAFYGTFLNLSLIQQLCEKLNIGDDLSLEEIGLNFTRWNFRMGAVTVRHRIGFDYDMESVAVLTQIASDVLHGSTTPEDGLRLIRQHEIRVQPSVSDRKDSPSPSSPSASSSSSSWSQRIESCYRDFPGRTLILPLMSSTCATVYFGGTWVDLGFAAITGLVGGLVACWASNHDGSITVIADYLAAMFAAMISMGSVVAFPDATCFKAQIMGTLYWFFYGTAFVVSFYEMMNNQAMTGIARFATAVMRSYGLAIGVLLGVWVSAYATDERWERIQDKCETKTHQISDLWMILLFPLSAIACLMQFRVRLGDFLVCLMVQTIAYGSQYVIGTVWKQPNFLANLIPAFLTVLASYACIPVAGWLKLSSFRRDKRTPPNRKKKTDADEATSSERTRSLDDVYNVSYVDSGWERGKKTGGYMSVDKDTYAESDIWFCMLPALYLLVPGSKLLISAFTNLLVGLGSNLPSSYLELDGLAASLLVIALGQSVGLRFGFATISAYWAVWTSVSDRRNHLNENSETMQQRPTTLESHPTEALSPV